MISIQKVRKFYGDAKALNNINMTIPKGSCYGLVGPNGAGKSTLMKILAGIIQDFDGTIQNDLQGDLSFGYVPQEICLEELLTAHSNLHFYGKIHKLKGKELAKQSEKILEQIGLTDRAKSKVSTYSGGMKRRLNIGCALVHDPEIILMDEPTVGIDPQSRRHIFDLVNMLKKMGKTIIYTSHYMEEVEKVCDHVAFIDHGKIIEQGSISDLLKRYVEPAVFIKGDIPQEWLAGMETTPKDGGWVILSSEPLDTLAHLAQRCQEAQMIPNDLSLLKPSLEDVFFTLTGTALRDTAA